MIDIPSIPIYSSSTGSFGTSRDLPSLDLAFALDKTLTARRGPTPTFTRSQTSPTGSTYFGSDGLLKYAAANEPRFDHDPVTLACKGLLIEESRTNSLLHSENFNNAYWLTTSGATTWQGIGSAPVITANYAASPSGLLSAYRLQLNLNGSTSSSDRSGFATGILSVTSGTTYTVSVYIKLLDSTTDAQLLASNIGIFTVAASATSQSVQDAGNGWKRIIRTYTSTSTSGTYRFQIVGGVGLNQVDCLIWGAQIEIGSFPTSYIPTTGTALQRSADVCSVTTAGWANAGDDTMLASYFVRQHVVGAIIVEGGPLISWLSLAIGSISGSNRAIYRHGGTATRFDASTTATYSLASMNKLALTSGEQLCLNGSLGQGVTGDPSQSDISTILSIGRRSDFLGQAYINGHIARIQYFRKRLPNAKLQSLTTP